ncbi:MAG: FAD-binding oxidoreductase [Verrucomicrobiaceae bacterium]|nr:MAG: FAD-binding oxidoreductase [Verrucomicrobiaceae bacterium]
MLLRSSVTVMEGVEWDAVVVGGGFFGAYLSLSLAERGFSVLLIEREHELMQRASYHNQARVHAGYHYPRSLMTAVRSRINFPRFVEDFSECIVKDFHKYYAIARILSKVTGDQFQLFMERVGASLAPAPEAVTRMFNPELIEAVFTTQEFAFDVETLRRVMYERLKGSGVHIHVGTEAECLTQMAGGGLQIHCRRDGARTSLGTQWVFNCTYSAINGLRHRSGLPLLPLKQELAEMALVEPPLELKGMAVTVMCGPFFSLMPFPARKLWTLSHVRYTPHCSWQDLTDTDYQDPSSQLNKHCRETNGPLMICDAARYLPAMANCKQRGSLWEVKSVLPQSENDDSRPILFHKDPDMPGLVSILGGKLDNIYDLPQELDELGLLLQTSC